MMPKCVIKEGVELVAYRHYLEIENGWKEISAEAFRALQNSSGERRIMRIETKDIRPGDPVYAKDQFTS